MCFEINRVQLVHRGVQRGRCSRTKRFPVQRARDADLRAFFDGLQMVVRIRDRKFVCENHQKNLVGCGFAMRNTGVASAWNNQPQWRRMPSNVAS
jgi:hypothetical protein